MKKILLLVAIFTMVLMMKTLVSADDNNHQHTRVLQKVVTDDSFEIPFCGEFYCPDCHDTFYDSITYKDVNMPIMNIEGSLEGISKDNKVTVSTTYSSEGLSFDSYATLKIQGASSASYPKKNYSLQFVDSKGKKNKVKLVDSWGKQHKYCLKANYIDYSQARNIVSARIYNDIIHSRNLDDGLNALDWGGVTDGYPIALFLNEKFLGLYTMNIPKDKWMYGMSDETIRQALLFAQQWSTSVKMKDEIADVNNVEADNWDIEYCSTEEDEQVGTAWVGESMNRYIRFLNNSTNEEFKQHVEEYTSVERSIDLLLYTYFIYAYDNTAKNIMWASYDGERWIPNMYDMDGTFGLAWDGSLSYSPSGFTPSSINIMFKRIWQNYYSEIKARYVELRENILSKGNIQREFASFIGNIPQVMYDADKAKWPSIPSTEGNNYNQIVNFASERIDFYDNYFGVEIDEQVEEAYNIAFNAPSGTKVYIYETQNYDAETPVESMMGFSRTKDGVPTKTDGQINFLVKPPKGYVINDITVSPSGGYKNIKGKEDTGKDNTYRITKITSDLTVDISIAKHEDHDTTGEVEYTWSDDNTTCTASGVCDACGQEFEEEVNTVSKVKREPNCTEDGLVEYTATFTKDGFEEQTKEVTIPKTSHNWGPASYLWSEDNSEATALSVCLNNSDHVKTETVATTSEVTRPATCTRKGETTYTATFTKDGFEAQAKTVENIDIVPHNLIHHEFTDATCEKDGNIECWECSECHKFFIEKEEGTKVEVSKEDTVIKSAHKLSKVDMVPATCLVDGTEGYYCCDSCGKMFADDKGETEIDEPAIISRTGHDWSEWITTKESTCVFEGQRIRICKNDPSHIEYEDVGLLNHTMTHHEKVEPTCTKTGNIEYWTCDMCNKIFADKDGKEEISKSDIIIPIKSHMWDAGEVIVPASSTSTGIELFTCKSCGTIRKSIIPKVSLDELTINIKTVTAGSIKQIVSSISKKGGTVDTIVLGPKVKKIKKNAFKGTDVKKIIIKTKKLKKKRVKKALKNSSVATLIIRVGNAKQNKKFRKKYKKIFKKKIVGKKVRVLA